MTVFAIIYVPLYNELRDALDRAARADQLVGVAGVVHTFKSSVADVPSIVISPFCSRFDFEFQFTDDLLGMFRLKIPRLPEVPSKAVVVSDVTQHAPPNARRRQARVGPFSDYVTFELSQ